MLICTHNALGNTMTSFLYTLVTKTNLSVHEDKYRVPYVKVSHQKFDMIQFDFSSSHTK